MFCNVRDVLKRKHWNLRESGSGERVAAIACALLVTADTILELFTGPVFDVRTLYAGFFVAILLLVCAVRPFEGNIALGVAWCVIFPLPIDLSMSVSLVIGLPLIVLTYRYVWWGVALSGAVTVSRIVQLAAQYWLPDRAGAWAVVSALPWIIMPTLACVGFGLLLKWRRSEEQREAEARRRAESLDLAARLHDATTNDLSYLIMSIDKLIAEKPLDADSVDLPMLREVAQRALDQTHDVIAVLSGQRPHTSQDAPRLRMDAGDRGRDTAPSNWLNKEAERHHKELAALGFQGEVIMPDSKALPAHWDQATAQLVSAFIKETFANIAKHADRERGYVFAAYTYQNCLRISVADVVTGTGDTSQDSSSSSSSSLGIGFGLAHLKQLIVQQGGWLRIRQENGYWSCLANIPIYHQDTA